MTCPACRHDNPDRAKFCLECGHRFAAASPQRPREWASAEADLRQAVSIARKIEYPNLIWPAAHALSAALAARAEAERTMRGAGDEARGLSVLASETIRSIAERAPDAALGRTFLAWSPVQAAVDDLERLRRT